jgi:cytoskeletal protein CcmA (bactofilin family)
MKTASRLLFLALILLTPCVASAQANSTEIAESGNMYISGAQLKIVAPVLGDLVAAGGRIIVEGSVSADAAVAGGSLDVRAPIGQDLRTAGGTIDITNNVGGDLVAAGGNVRIEETSKIAGSAMLTGGEVFVAGNIGKGAKIFARKITLAGQINGDTRLFAQEIEFSPTARINGNLTYASATPLKQDIATQVSGTITQDKLPESRQAERKRSSVKAWFQLAGIFSLLLAGTLLYLIFPNAVDDVQNSIRRYPLRTLLIGLGLLFAVPPVAILFMVTVIGIPIGITLLFAYPVMILLGYLAAAFFVGRQTANAMKQPERLSLLRRVIFLALGLIILALVGWIPYLGGLVLFIALVLGIGGWAVGLRVRYQARERNLEKPSENTISALD